ncbi:hypothetical protein NJ7G_0365 [Natrinema sp. J7-2]|nr:hypothetical protein NJ7G_0365 [Natrinema sp. J7-2]
MESLSLESSPERAVPTRLRSRAADIAAPSRDPRMILTFV